MKYALKRPTINRTRNQFPFDGLLNAFFDDNNQTKCSNHHPPTNVVEKEDAYRLDIAAPGLDKNLFTIEVDKDQLVIAYKSVETKDEVVEKFNRKEFSYGNFERKFHLPETIDTETINATYDNGILQVVLTKKEEAKDKGIRKIEIG